MSPDGGRRLGRGTAVQPSFVEPKPQLAAVQRDRRPLERAIRVIDFAQGDAGEKKCGRHAEAPLAPEKDRPIDAQANWMLVSVRSWRPMPCGEGLG